MNAKPAMPASNQAIVALGSDGSIAVRNSAGTASVTVDIVGYFSPTSDGTFVATDPARVLDTRNGIGAATAKIPAHGVLDLAIPSDVVPDDALAVSANVSVPVASTSSRFRMSDTAVAAAADPSVTYVAGYTASSGGLFALSSGHLYITNDGASAEDIVIDITGFFEGGGDGTSSTFTPLVSRAYNTAASSPIAAGATRQVSLAAVLGSSPAGSVALNVTTVLPAGRGYLTVWPDEEDVEPGTASNTYIPGASRASFTTVPLGESRTLKLTNHSDQPVDVIVDTQGWFSEESETAPQTADCPEPSMGASCLTVLAPAVAEAPTGDERAMTSDGEPMLTPDELLQEAVLQTVASGDTASANEFLAGAASEGGYSQPALTEANQAAQLSPEQAQQEQESTGDDDTTHVVARPYADGTLARPYGSTDFHNLGFYYYVMTRGGQWWPVSTYSTHWNFWLNGHGSDAHHRGLSGYGDVKAGQSSGFPHVSCVIKNNRKYLYDPNVYTWPNCPDAERRYITKDYNLPMHWTTFYGTKGNRYYNFYEITVNPKGEKFGPRTFYERRPDWKVPDAGGDPFWPSQ